jgi:O-antigen/teichoic acid export membrane protein
MTNRLSQNTLILLISNGGSAVLSFLLAVLIGRFYGEAGLGIYASVLAWIFPLSFIVEFGFGTLITRDIAQQPNLASDYLRLTWQFRIINGAIIIVVLGFMSPIMTDTPLGLVISSPLIIILPAYSAYTAIFRAHQRMHPIAFLNLGMLITQVIFTSLAIFTQTDLTWLFVINTLTSLGQLFVARWIYRQYFYTKPKSNSNLRLRDLIRQSRPFAIAGIISAIQVRFSILWLETNSTATIIGLFVASLRFIDGAKMIPNALFGAVYPALSSLSDNRQALNRLFIKIMLALGTYGIIVSVFLRLFAGDILLITFGEDFIQARSALFIMGLMLIPLLLRSGWSLYWYALGREQAVNRVLMINLLMLIIIPTMQWVMTPPPAKPLEIIIYSMLYTELITIALMLVSEVIIWRTNSTSEIA